MDFELTDEQRLIKDTAREFTDKEIVKQSRENARNHHFDVELVKKIAAQGYLGAIVPTEYGGAGLDYLSYGLIVEEIGRGDSAIRTVISVQTSLVCSGILKWGTEEQKQQVPAEAVLGRVAGLLRADRAGHGLGRGQPEDAREEDRRRLGDQRREDVDLDGQLREGRADLRADRPGARPQGAGVLSRRHRPAGLQSADDRAQDGPARLRHGVDLAGRRGGVRRRRARRGRPGLQSRDVQPRLRALLGGGGLRGHLPGLRGGVGQLRQGARAVRPPDRELPAGAGDDRRHDA